MAEEMKIENHRFKITIETREITYTDPKTRAQIVYQRREKMIFKRYGKDEKAALEALKQTLLPYFSTDYEILSCEEDKTRPVK